MMDMWTMAVEVVMGAYRVETTLTKDSTLMLNSLPFKAGETVEVVIQTKPTTQSVGPRYPLKGLPATYSDPTGPVAQSDWEAAR